MKITKVFIGVVFEVSLLLAIFFALLVCKPFYRYEYNVHPEIQFSSLTESQYVNFSSQIVNYFFSNNATLFIKDVNNKMLNDFFTDREIAHMKDVRNLIRFFVLLMAICILLSVLGFLKMDKKQEFLKSSSFISIMLTLIITMIAVLDFEDTFIIFHKILFRNNLWLLPQNARLIEMFPENFFYDFAKVWLFSFIAVNGIIYFVSISFVRSKNA